MSIEIKEMTVKSTIVSDHPMSQGRDVFSPEDMEKLKRSIMDEVRAMIYELLNEKKDR